MKIKMFAVAMVPCMLCCAAEPMKVLVSGAEGTVEAAAYFPRVAREMGFAVELIDAKGDLEGALRREQPRVTVLGEDEATLERMARVRAIAPKTALHVQEGWAAARPRKELLARAKEANLTVIPVGEAMRLYRATAEGKASDPAPGGRLNDEGRYLLGCTYLATLLPADMIQLIWWPASIPCARAERMRIMAERAATGESARRAEDAPQAEKAVCITWEALKAAPAPGKVIGRLATRSSKEIASSRWSVGCETMDRDYATFRNFRRYVGGTGVRHARLQSGWEKTEKVHGAYDFAWFDEHVRGLAAEGVKPWVCLCYGNPIYNSSQRMRWAVARITEDPEGFPAWVRYVEATVKRYSDVVDTWEVWNEPFFKQVPYYAKLVKATAETIRRIQPKARIWVSAPGTYENCEKLVGALKANGAVDLVEGWVYHPYVKNPDAEHDDHFDWGTVNQGRLAELVRALGPRHYIVQGETGCPAQLEYSHALNNRPWTECSQVKWNLRSMMRAAANEVRLYSVFAMIDFQYRDFMLQSFGLLRADLAKEVVYRRPLYYACRNVFSLFDGTVKGEGMMRCACNVVEWADANERGRPRAAAAAKFSKGGMPIVALWLCDRIPSDSRGFDRAEVTIPGVEFREPVWVDLVTGRVCELDGFGRVPVWDCPVLIAERAAIPLADEGEGAGAELVPKGNVDRTAELMAAVRAKSRAGGGTVSLAKGVYHFRHTSATPVEVYISNHDQPMPRPVQLPFEGITNVTVNGNGSLLLFHGETCGFLLRGCSGVTLRNFAIDWEDPCILETTIVATPPGGTEVSVDRAKFPCRVEDGGVVLYGDGWRHPLFRESKMFDGVTHEVVPLSGDVLDSGKARELPNGNLLLAVEYAKAGKGGKPGDRVCLRSRRADKVGRPCPAVTVTRSKDTVMEDVTIHTAFGMGVICQLSENFTWRGTKGADAKTAGMFPRAGTGRYASGNADASHFSNVKGVVREEGCWFEAMMDDAINVHSTCMAITNVLAPDRIVCRYMHKQAIGLDVFGPGDTLRLIKGNTLENGPELKVVAAKGIGAMEMELTLAGPLPEGYGCGDAVENADYQPAVVFRGNVVARNRARGTLFTTPRPVLVESNRFELVSGSAILFAGDAHYWYESGACRDVTVRENVFSNCLTSARSHGFCHGVISFCPIVHEMQRQRHRYHGNIRIEDNLIYTFDAPLLYAYSTENLTWRRNKVLYNDYCPSWGKPPFVVEHCGEILVDGKRLPDAAP